MLIKLMHFVVRFLSAPRVILDRAGGSPYLSRWYLIGKKPALDAHGNPLPGSDHGGLLQVLLHRFHRDDHDDALHSHPWKLAIAFVLAGGYVEYRRVGDAVEKRIVRPGSFNILRQDDFHRVELIGKESWSLFVTWRKVTTWFYWDPAKRARAKWRGFLDWKQEGAAEPRWLPDRREP